MPIDSVTLSDGHGPGERALTRLIVNAAAVAAGGDEADGADKERSR